MVHVKCRSPVYPRSDNQVIRITIPDELVPWSANFQDYKPTIYTHPGVLSAEWADPEITSSGFAPRWNQLDGKIDRHSHTGEYIVDSGLPRNPEGRTGLCGRGVLGKWGPNHAADPIVTRWKRDSDGNQIMDAETNHPVLQFVSIQRHDSGEWAIPGGMVDPGEQVTSTLKREFQEEALNIIGKDKQLQKKISDLTDKLFGSGQEVYRGYVDDPRNTDNAWMETVAMNFHDETGELTAMFPFEAGDDAKSVQWMDISESMPLYASHSKFLEKVAKAHAAHWRK